MTVAQLREFIKDLPDNMKVKIDNEKVFDKHQGEYDACLLTVCEKKTYNRGCNNQSYDMIFKEELTLFIVGA